MLYEVLWVIREVLVTLEGILVATGILEGVLGVDGSSYPLEGAFFIEDLLEVH